MRRFLTIFVALLFSMTAYLILVDAIRPWVILPKVGHVGFTVIFVLFAVAHCAALEGFRRTALFFVLSALVSYLLEEIGVRTGFIFGHYHYSNMLGPKLGSVPLIIPLAWFMMIYPSWRVSQALLRGTNLRSFAGSTAQALFAAILMTAWDTVMDPGNAAAGLWVWEKGGSYFGVPIHNYVGWLLTTFLIFWPVSQLWRRKKQIISAAPILSALPVIIYALYGLRYITADTIPALRIVAVFSMGMPGLLALTRILLSRVPNDSRPQSGNGLSGSSSEAARR